MDQSRAARTISQAQLTQAQEAIQYLSSLPIPNRSVDGNSGASTSTRPDLIARCDNALARLRGTPTSTVRQELLSNIHGSRSLPRPAKRQKVVWKHKFYCLASVDSTQVPLKEYYKDALFRAGLGKKAIEASDSSYFCDGGKGAFFLCNTTGLQKNDYWVLGKYAGVSVRQGGPGFAFFHPHVYMYICTGIWSPVAIAVDSLPNYTLRETARKMLDSREKEDLQSVLSEENVIDLITEAGYVKSLGSVEISDRNTLISVITTYHMFVKTKAMMDQFKDGLEDSGVFSYLKTYEDQLRPLFVNERLPLTATQVKDLFHPVIFVSEGTNRRDEEEQAYIYFSDFLDAAEAKQFATTLGDILVFFSGADYPPPMGFKKKPTFKFLESVREKRFPTASTCSLTLCVPTIHSSFEDFTEAMTMGILGNDGFGGGP